MAPLIILIAVFLGAFLLSFYVERVNLTLSYMGRLAMAIMLVFTGISHFIATAEMILMLPEFMPWKREIVYFTGIFELVASLGIMQARFARVTSMLLIAFYVAVLPANIIGNINEVDLSGMDAGTKYLFFRIPLQLFFIAWTYYFGIRKAP